MNLVFCKDITTNSILELIEEISELQNEKLALQITSHGGSVEALADFKAFLISKKIVIDTIACGCVASAAVSMFMLGNNRIMAPDSYLIIHEPIKKMRHNASFDIYDFQKEIIRIEEIRNSMFYDLFQKTKITPDSLKKKIYKRNWKIKKKEAKSLGITTS